MSFAGDLTSNYRVWKYARPATYTQLCLSQSVVFTFGHMPHNELIYYNFFNFCNYYLSLIFL
jgi:hypothetical protein